MLRDIARVRICKSEVVPLIIKAFERTTEAIYEDLYDGSDNDNDSGSYSDSDIDSDNDSDSDSGNDSGNASGSDSGEDQVRDGGDRDRYEAIYDIIITSRQLVPWSRLVTSATFAELLIQISVARQRWLQRDANDRLEPGSWAAKLASAADAFHAAVKTFVENRPDQHRSSEEPQAIHAAHHSRELARIARLQVVISEMRTRLAVKRMENVPRMSSAVMDERKFAESDKGESDRDVANAMDLD